MTRSLHTPGPWKASWQFIVAPDPNGIHPDIYIAEIAILDDDGRIASLEQQVDNAILMAEAPNLLDAVLDIKRLADKADERDYDSYERVLLDLIAHRVRQALCFINGRSAS